MFFVEGKYFKIMNL